MSSGEPFSDDEAGSQRTGAPATVGLGHGQPTTLRCLEKKLDLHCLERENNSAVVGTIDDPGGK